MQNPDAFSKNPAGERNGDRDSKWEKETSLIPERLNTKLDAFNPYVNYDQPPVVNRDTDVLEAFYQYY